MYAARVASAVAPSHSVLLLERKTRFPLPPCFCQFPAGAANLGPAETLAGRDMGSDFSGRNGWSMYHGETVPGFPKHPHRG